MVSLDQQSECPPSTVGDGHDHFRTNFQCLVVHTDRSSLIGRFVAILTPVFAVAAGWFAGVIAQAVPGAHLDQNQIVAFMTAAAVSAITAGWKWLRAGSSTRRW